MPPHPPPPRCRSPPRRTALYLERARCVGDEQHGTCGLDASDRSEKRSLTEPSRVQAGGGDQRGVFSFDCGHGGSGRPVAEDRGAAGPAALLRRCSGTRQEGRWTRTGGHAQVDRQEGGGVLMKSGLSCPSVSTGTFT